MLERRRSEAVLIEARRVQGLSEFMQRPFLEDGEGGSFIEGLFVIGKGFSLMPEWLYLRSFCFLHLFLPDLPCNHAAFS